MENIVVLGAGGFAREVKWLINDIGDYKFLGFIDKYDPIPEIVGLCAVIGIGSPRIISNVSDEILKIKYLKFPNLVHPSVMYDKQNINLGKGNIICARNILTTDIRIGSFNILNLSSTYGHDVTIGNSCVINPGCNISGGVTLEGKNLIGTGAQILENITIGHGAMVGAGAVVTKNVEPGAVVIGVPAKPMRDI